MTTVDARGYSCPEPVIMTRKALMSKEAEYAIMVDNTASRENVTRYAEPSGLQGRGCGGGRRVYADAEEVR